MEDQAAEHAPSDPRRFPCAGCGAEVVFAPGVARLKCPYCGAETDIPDAAAEPVAELDFRTYVSQLADHAESVDRIESHCDTCGANVVFPDNVTSHDCPFCSSHIVAVGRSVKLIRPGGVLPFRVDREGVLAAYREWIRGRWLAPNDLKDTARLDKRLSGMYLPFWTFDAAVTTDYQGQRGEHYWVTQTYTDSQGRMRSRQVRRTRWYPAAGRVFDRFNDLLVVATRSLETPRLEGLEPWDLTDIEPYRDAYLAGFGAESYAIDLADGFVRAQELMLPRIRSTICGDIGGDEQRIIHMTPRYNDISFKHILLPVWIMAYRYNNKPYQVLVNARTGEVLGDRPYSWVKITGLVLVVLAIIAAVAAVVWFNNH